MEGTTSLGQFLAHELADGWPVRPSRDLRHHVGHHSAEVPQRRRACLRDRVVDDLLDRVFRHRFRHELLDDGELTVLLVGLLGPVALAKRIRRLPASLALALEHLQLLVLLERPLHVLLGGPERRERHAQGVRALLVAGAHRSLQLVLDLCDQAHSNGLPPPSTCQCRWKTVWPAPGPTLTTT